MLAIWNRCGDTRTRLILAFTLGAILAGILQGLGDTFEALSLVIGF